MRLAVLLALLLLWGCDMPYGLPEPPPDAYRGRPIPPGWRVRELPTPEAVDAFCRADNLARESVNRLRAGQGDAVLACTNPHTKTLTLPAVSSAVSAALQSALRDHEVGGHMYGLQHGADGHGWVDEFGNPVTDQLTPAQEAVLRAKLQANAETEKRLMMMRQMYPNQPQGLMAIGQTR